MFDGIVVFLAAEIDYCLFVSWEQTRDCPPVELLGCAFGLGFNGGEGRKLAEQGTYVNIKETTISILALLITNIPVPEELEPACKVDIFARDLERSQREETNVGKAIAIDVSVGFRDTESWETGHGTKGCEYYLLGGQKGTSWTAANQSDVTDAD